MKSSFGWSFDGIGSAQPHATGARPFERFAAQHSLEQRILTDVRRCVPLKNNRPGKTVAVTVRPLADPSQVRIPNDLRQPNNLERAVSLQGPRHVIVDPLPWPREQAWLGVIVLHDEISVGLITLQGNPDRKSVV